MLHTSQYEVNKHRINSPAIHNTRIPISTNGWEPNCPLPNNNACCWFGNDDEDDGAPDINLFTPQEPYIVNKEMQRTKPRAQQTGIKRVVKAVSQMNPTQVS
jgi:hypothetical protein